MPTITVEGPPIAVDKKRRLVSGLWEVAKGVYDDIRPEAIVVLIKENHPENVGVGGELLAVRRAKGAARTCGSEILRGASCSRTGGPRAPARAAPARAVQARRAPARAAQARRAVKCRGRAASLGRVKALYR